MPMQSSASMSHIGSSSKNGGLSSSASTSMIGFSLSNRKKKAFVIPKEKLDRLAKPVERPLSGEFSRGDDSKNCTFMPVVSKSSDDTSKFMDRLVKYSADHERKSTAMAVFSDPHCTFSPLSSRPKSTSKKNAKEEREIFLKRMTEYETDKKQRIHQLQQQSLAETLKRQQPSPVARKSLAPETTFMERLSDDLQKRAAKDRADESKKMDTKYSFKPTIFSKKGEKPGTIDDFLGRLSGDIATRERRSKLRDHIFGLDKPDIVDPKNKSKRHKKKPTFMEMQKNLSKLYKD